MIKNPKTPENYRYTVIDSKTHQKIYLNNIDVDKYHQLMAQHHKYLKSEPKALILALQVSDSKANQVLIWLLENTSISHEIRYSQRELSNILQISLPTLSKILIRLSKDNLLIIDVGGITLSPKLFFYGSDKAFIKSLHKFNRHSKKSNHKKLNKQQTKQFDIKRIKTRMKKRKMLQNKDKLELRKLCQSSHNNYH